MKKIILLGAFFAFSLAKTGLYISYDLSATAEVELDVYGYTISDSEDYDSGALTVGFERDFGNSMAAGISYDLVGLDYDGADEGDKFFNLYGKYFYPVNPSMKLWGSLGYGMPQGDLDDPDIDGGLCYGVGLSMNNGVGFSYSLNNVELDGGTGTVSRLSLSYSF